MTDTTTQTVEPTEVDPEGKSSTETNPVNLRTQNDELKTENMRLSVFEHKDVVRRAGFDPEAGEGKSLARDLAAGLVEVEEGQDLHEVLVGYADTEYGWKPQTQLTETEKTQVDGSKRLTTLSQSTTSDNPPENNESDYAQRIAEAREAENWALASALEREFLSKQGKKSRAG